jgi:hypothetical protein
VQAPGRGTVPPPIGVALDGDFGNRLDAALAVAMLNGLAAKGEARRIALCVSRPSLESAQIADVLSAFYAGRPSAPRGGVGGNPAGMIGMPEAGARGGAPLAAVLATKDADGTPLYASGIGRVRDTAESAVLMRNMLLAQRDGNAAIVVAGPATDLARLLALYGARPQISAKVGTLVVALGSYPSGPADPSVKADVSAAKTLFAEWPTPIVAVGSEVGAALPYPATSIDRDFTWAPAHPVVDLYRVGSGSSDAPAGALAAVLHAVHPDAGYFTLSEPGTIGVLDDGRTPFTPSAGGTHRYLMVDASQRERVIAAYTELVSSKPVRPGRRGGDD